jgi:hypothetical protein
MKGRLPKFSPNGQAENLKELPVPEAYNGRHLLAKET